MPLHDEFLRVPCHTIVIKSDRQRRKVDTSGLRESIAAYGVLQPIVVNRLPDSSLELVFGERRLTSCTELGLPDIPVRFLSDLSPVELKLLEFEENNKRSDLHWRDMVAAVAEIHLLQFNSSVAAGDAWTMADTGRLLNYSSDWIRKLMRVHADIDSAKIATAPDINSAYNILSKFDQRTADNALSDLLSSGSKAFLGATQAEGQGQLPLDTETILAGIGAPSGPGNGATPNPTQGTAPLPIGPTLGQDNTEASPRPSAPPESILNISFLDWAPYYTGPKFNLIHCDFPYGVNVFDGSQGAQGTASSADMGQGGIAKAKARLYDDKESTYWELIDCLCDNLDKLMAHAGHLMFWFSMKHYNATLERFRKHAPDLDFNTHPLVWVKSDNKGIISDAKRGPRNIYETCLFASRGDRLIVKSISNAYAAPTDKLYHMSAKPEPVLRHFMGMLVDETTSLLDPTCGSGSALRAAESLGARRVLGLELDPDHCDIAKDALRKFRLMRSIG